MHPRSIFKLGKNKRKDDPGHFGSREPVTVDSPPKANLATTPATHRKALSDSHNLPAKAQIYNGAPNSASSRNYEKGDGVSEAPQKSRYPDKSTITIANAGSKAYSVLGFESTQGHKVTPLDPGRTFHNPSVSNGSTVHAQSGSMAAHGYSHRFTERASAFRMPSPRHTKLPQQLASELPADEISQPAREDKRVLQVPAEIGSSSRAPSGELEAQNNDRPTHDKVRTSEDLVFDGITSDQHSNSDELYVDSSHETGEMSLVSREHTEQSPANFALQHDNSSNGGENRHICGFSQNESDYQAVVQKTNQPVMATRMGTVYSPTVMTHPQTIAGSKGPLLPGRQISAIGDEENTTAQQQSQAISPLSDDIDPKRDSLRLLKKENTKLAKENRTLLYYKQRYDLIYNQKGMAHMRIVELTQKLEQIQQEKQGMHHDLKRERKESNDYLRKLRSTESELRNTEQVASETKNRLRGCKEELGSCSQENDRLKSIAMKAQSDLKVANDKHAAEVSSLKDEHKRDVIRLEQDKKSITAKAEQDLEIVNSKHATEVLYLNEEHKRTTDAIISKLQDEMSIKMQNMQAIIGEKSRAIAAQDLRMASYNKQIHGVITDGELGHKFQDLSLMIDSLVNLVPRPQEYVVDTALDPGNFLERNSSRGSRVWRKFLRKVCWDVLIGGFFQRQPGFGSFGCQGDGYLTLLHLYKLFAKSNVQDPSNCKVDFPNNKVSNSWRASLFEAILNEVTSTVNDHTVTGFSAFFRGNVKIVTNDLIKTLQKVCQGVLDSRCSKIILKLCHEVGILSLQMGAQQSVIVLETCHYEDWIQFGAAFKDDNYYNENKLQVDIMVQPSLKRIGDGGQDLTTEKVLVIGDIVSLKAGV